jgi:hypothetical protein
LSSSDEFARELFEDAKQSLRQAGGTASEMAEQRHLRHAILSAFSFLELQIDLIAQHFRESDFFTLHERALITQKDIVFDKGAFKIKEKNRFTRLEDRMLLLQNKFKGSKLAERAWWEPLKQGTDRRNSIAHPRSPISLKPAEVEADLTAVLSCASDLFAIVFGKRLPYESFGLKPKVSK